MLKFKFYIIFTYHETLCFLFFPTVEKPKKHSPAHEPSRNRWQVRFGLGTVFTDPRQRWSSLLLDWPSGSAWWIYFQASWMRNIPCETLGNQILPKNWWKWFSHQLLTTFYSRWLAYGANRGPDCESLREGSVGSPCAYFQSFPRLNSSSLVLTHVRAPDFSGADASQGSWRWTEAIERDIQ